jgi:CYTH domain-containing protein
MEKKIEKERKWLLKKVPDAAMSSDVKSYDIEQFYTSDGWRYRKTTNQGNGKYNFVKIKKQSIGRGVNSEVEFTKVSEREYNSVYPGDRVINKSRHVIEHGKLKIEIDEFDSLALVIAEVEDVEINDHISFPPEIERLILMEVTGNPLFDNYNLAEPEEDEDDYGFDNLDEDEDGPDYDADTDWMDDDDEDEEDK